LAQQENFGLKADIFLTTLILSF